MSALTLVGLLLSVMTAAYLVYVMMRPERF
jgi:K+-transporting ATPase KdpF subunit